MSSFGDFNVNFVPHCAASVFAKGVFHARYDSADDNRKGSPVDIFIAIKKKT